MELNLNLIIQLLEDDYVLISAGDGGVAIELATVERPDLILMDMSLPVMDGWTATCEIKEDPELSHIPIVGLSAHAMGGDQQRALVSGCDAYLTKPVDEELLVATIEKLLRE